MSLAEQYIEYTSNPRNKTKTVNDFFDFAGIITKNRTDFAYAAILKQAQELLMEKEPGEFGVYPKDFPDYEPIENKLTSNGLYFVNFIMRQSAVVGNDPLLAEVIIKEDGRLYIEWVNGCTASISQEHVNIFKYAPGKLIRHKKEQ